MYTPAHFAPSDDGAALEAMERWPLAILITDGPHATHLPMKREGDTLVGHIAKANPHWTAAPDGSAALAVFNGPSTYISPGFYATKAEHGRVVPTWNYVSIHVRGQLTWLHDAAEKLHIVRTLTDQFEARELRPWSVDDAPRSYMDSMLNGIVGVRIVVERIDAKFKLSQNRSEDDRSGVELGLEGRGDGASEDIARLMRVHLPRSP
jgi:transcriptional regulator